MATISYDYEVVVIGSGFGGGVLACRTSKAWPGKVLVLERGKRYPMGSFPRTPHDMARNFWYRPDEDRARPDLASEEELHGMFDIRNFRNMDAVVCAGYGGGSLIYANVYMQPPDEVFAKGGPNRSIEPASSHTTGSRRRYLGLARFRRKTAICAERSCARSCSRKSPKKKGGIRSSATSTSSSAMISTIPPPSGSRRKTGTGRCRPPACIAANAMSAATRIRKTRWI